MKRKKFSISFENSKITSIILTLILLAAILFSGPASAVRVGLNDLPETVWAGQEFDFQAYVDIDTSERVPFQNFTLEISHGGETIYLVFDINGNIIDHSNNLFENIEITPYHNYLNYGYGYLFGYGYGYDGSSWGIRNYIFGEGYGYEYGYGYGHPNYLTSELLFNIKVDTNGSQPGNYRIRFYATAAKDNNFYIFSSHDYYLTILEQTTTTIETTLPTTTTSTTIPTTTTTLSTTTTSLPDTTTTLQTTTSLPDTTTTTTSTTTIETTTTTSTTLPTTTTSTTIPTTTTTLSTTTTSTTTTSTTLMTTTSSTTTSTVNVYSGGGASTTTIKPSTYAISDEEAYSYLGSAKAGESYLFNFSKAKDLNIREIEIKFSSDSRGIRIEVEKLDSLPKDISSPLISIASTDGKVYGYFRINCSVPNQNISSIKITFDIPKSWIIENGLDPSTIVLARYTEQGWISYSSRIVGSDEQLYRFEASIPGFSIFAIIGDKAKPTTTTVATTIPTTIMPITTTTIYIETTTIMEIGEEVKKEEAKDSLIIPIILSILVIIAIVALSILMIRGGHKKNTATA